MAAEIWTENVTLNSNFCHNLKGFRSKANIIAQNNSGWIPF